MKKNIIDCKDLTVSYGKYQALGPVSIKLPAQKKIAILGPNGSGKSSLIKAIVGLIRHRGSVKRNYQNGSYTAQRQEVNWSFPITCREVVEMGLYSRVGWFRGLDKQSKQQVWDALDKLGMADYYDRPIRALSIGQQQRVFLARALVDDKAELFLFDEPFAGVDAKTEKVIYDLFNDLIIQGKSVICVHHNLYDTSQHFDYGVLINQSLIAEGPIHQVLSQENLHQAYGTGIVLPEVKNSLAGATSG